MSQQLAEWRGRFGRAYTRRNYVHWPTRVAGFYQMVGHLGLGTILEVGCNRGHNLHALKHLYPYAAVQGVEPQRYARKLAQADGLYVTGGSIYKIPFPAASFDLAFTCGVLTHVPPSALDRALTELARVSARYVLAIEYAGDGETIEYRGHQDMLWRRNYTLPGWTLLRTGDLDEHFDQSRYWLFEAR